MPPEPGRRRPPHQRDVLGAVLVERQHGQAGHHALVPARRAGVDHHALSIGRRELVKLDEQHRTVGPGPRRVRRSDRVAHVGALRIVVGVVVKAAGEHEELLAAAVGMRAEPRPGRIADDRRLARDLLADAIQHVALGPGHRRRPPRLATRKHDLAAGEVCSKLHGKLLGHDALTLIERSPRQVASGPRNPRVWRGRPRAGRRCGYARCRRARRSR